MGQETHHIQKMEHNELLLMQQMIPTILKSSSMEDGCMIIDVKNRLIRTVEKSKK